MTKNLVTLFIQIFDAIIAFFTLILRHSFPLFESELRNKSELISTVFPLKRWALSLKDPISLLPDWKSTQKS